MYGFLSLVPKNPDWSCKSEGHGTLFSGSTRLERWTWQSCKPRRAAGCPGLCPILCPGREAQQAPRPPQVAGSCTIQQPIFRFLKKGSHALQDAKSFECYLSIRYKASSFYCLLLFLLDKRERIRWGISCSKTQITWRQRTIVSLTVQGVPVGLL